MNHKCREAGVCACPAVFKQIFEDDTIDKALAPKAWETSWGNPVTTEKLIERIIDEGFHVIRYPVSWRNHIGEASEYKIDEKWKYPLIAEALKKGRK